MMKRSPVLPMVPALLISLTVGLTFAVPVQAEPLTCSDVFTVDVLRSQPSTPGSGNDLEVDQANRVVNDAVRKSRNRAPIEAFIRGIYDKASTQQIIPLAGDRALELKKVGVGKPEELFLTAGGETVLLFSTATLARNGAYHYHLASVNVEPQGEKAAIVIERHGSIDDFEIIVLSLTEKKILSRGLLAKSSDLTWNGPDQFTFQQEVTVGNRQQMTYDLKTGKATKAPHRARIEGKDGWSVSYTDHWTLESKSGRKLSLEHLALRKVVGKVSGGLVITLADGQEQEHIFLVMNPETATEARLQALQKTKEAVLDNVSIQGDFVLAQVRSGGRKSVEINDTTHGLRGNVELPSCCRVTSLNFDSAQQKLQVGLASSFNNGDFSYDLKTKKWQPGDLEATLMRKDGVDFKSEIVNVPSADGTLIPMRLTYRKDLQADKKRPVLMEVYGGFGASGPFDRPLGFMSIELLKRGGIYAAPALRGGDEFGEQWHQQAVYGNKSKTIEDLKAAASWLSDAWSNPKMIATTGASNGGFVVASAGLAAPDHFGLVIPVVGVHDLLQIKNLDPRYVSGWETEYGDADDADQLDDIKKISPLELAKSGEMPNFLIISGRNDSRVNRLHSERLYAALLEKKPKDKFVEMIQLKNSGHFLLDGTYQGLPSLHVNVVKWVTLFDYFGLQF